MSPDVSEVYAIAARRTFCSWLTPWPGAQSAPEPTDMPRRPQTRPALGAIRIGN